MIIQYQFSKKVHPLSPWNGKKEKTYKIRDNYGRYEIQSFNMHRSNGQLHENARVKAAIPFVSFQSKISLFFFFQVKIDFSFRVMIFFFVNSLPE